MSDDRAVHLGIVELHGVSRRFAAHHDELFRTLGTWTPTTTEPGAQQLFAEASHRHAWHAELWRERTPAIPIKDAGTVERLVDPGTSDRLAAYATVVSHLTAMTEATDARVDATLDPSTHRVAELTLADLDRLGRRLTALT